MRQVEASQSLPSGARVHVSGNDTGPPLLFFHGVGGGAWSWRAQVEALAASHACYVWEARGHGAAARVADAGLADYYADAGEALASVRAQTSHGITLIGHSMGGLLAIALAARDPDRINGLILVDPVYPDGEHPAGHDLGPFKPVVLALMKPLVRSFLADGLVARTIARWMFVNSFTDRARMEVAWRDQRRQIPIEYPKMFFEAFGLPEGFPVLPFAERIDIPVQTFNARSHDLTSTLARRLGERFADERIRGGHYLQLDQPVDVNERLVRFLRERIDT